MNPLLEVDQLTIYVKQDQKHFPVIKDLNFKIFPGECVGIVGESGCGKTLTAHTIAGLASYFFEGQIVLDGKNLQGMNERQTREIRRKQLSLIFQNPQACLNPTMRVGKQIQEVAPFLTLENVYSLLTLVGLSDVERCYKSYPHELSGGMCQRVMIAIALAKKPKLLIADEPTTALDVTIQAQILNVLKNIQLTQKLGILLITHDLGVVKQICDRVLVMYAGIIMEAGSVDQILKSPQNPYTRALISSRLKFGEGKKQSLQSVHGYPPSLLNSHQQSCPFVSRCSDAMPICMQKKPPMKTQSNGQQVACWHYSKVSYDN